MTFLAWLQITSHYYPILQWIGGLIFIIGGCAVFYGIHKAGALV